MNTSIEQEYNIHLQKEENRKQTHTQRYTQCLTIKQVEHIYIYIIVNTIDDDIYAGSKCETLGQIMATHRSNMKSKPQ